jgi:hypothetical protein
MRCDHGEDLGELGNLGKLGRRLGIKANLKHMFTRFPWATVSHPSACIRSNVDKCSLSRDGQIGQGRNRGVTGTCQDVLCRRSRPSSDVNVNK